MQAQQVDQAKMEAFVGKVLGDASAMMTIALCHIGDKLGLFGDLAERGAGTSEEIARRNGLNERYVREWLGGMVSSGYLEYDPGSGRFALPAEHVPVLVQEGGPVFFGGVFQMVPAGLAPVGQVIDAFRNGGGVQQSAYPDDWWAGMERFTASWFESHLLQEWMPAMPDTRAKLENGCDVADIGCGSGRALIKLAGAFPKSRYVGYDIAPQQLERARKNVEAAGLSDRISFKQADASKGLPEKYDVVTTFDVIHDAIDPMGLLKAIRNGLKADGKYICLDINSSDKLEDNVGPLGAMFHGFSVLYCMTTSLANGGTGLGTVGFHEKKAREMCKEATFSDVRRVPLDNPFNILYEISA